MSYPTKDFKLYEANVFGRAADGMSIGSWAACPPCVDLIEAVDLDGLVDRALARYPAAAKRATILRTLQEGFLAHRTGPPRLMSAAEIRTADLVNAHHDELNESEIDRLLEGLDA